MKRPRSAGGPGARSSGRRRGLGRAASRDRSALLQPACEIVRQPIHGPSVEGKVVTGEHALPTAIGASVEKGLVPVAEAFAHVPHDSVCILLGALEAAGFCDFGKGFIAVFDPQEARDAAHLPLEVGEQVCIVEAK